MIRTRWHDRPFNLRRIVLRDDLPARYAAAFRELADSLRLQVGGDGAEVHSGDLWVGCYPVCDWEEADPKHVQWVSPLEISIAQAWLSRLVREVPRLDTPDDETLPALVVRG